MAAQGARRIPPDVLRALGVIAAIAAAGHAAGQPQGPAPLHGASTPRRVSGQPYTQHTTTDRFGRAITFYLSEAPPEPRLPLLAYIQGSGWTPHFEPQDGRLRPRNGHATIADAARGRARLLIVEKPGVEPFGNPSQEQGGPAEFRREHTLDRWSEAVMSAMRAARTLPGVAPVPSLVIGHSEGGLVACRVAAELDDVTHVACLAGGGPTQLFDILELARRGEFFKRISDDPDARAAHVLEQWQRISADPGNPDAVFFGHAYLRWATFCASSPMEELLRTDARVFIAQGAADRAVTRESFEALRAHLLAHGRDVTGRLVEGADHSFAPAAGDADGWRAIMEEILDWWLAPPEPEAQPGN